MQVVPVGDEFHVIDPNGRMLVAWPSEAEARAWLTGVVYGVDASLQAIHLADEDTRRRMEGLVRIVQNFGTDVRAATVERRKAG